MSSPVAVSSPRDESAAKRRRSVLLVFLCTVVGAAAQIFMKLGMEQFSLSVAGTLLNVPLILGYTLYGVNTLMLVLALRDAPLSLLYPIIALTYVWVTLVSYTLLHEPPNAYKNIGISTIVVGVAILGRGGRQ